MSKTKDEIREYEHDGKHFVDVDLTVTLSRSAYYTFKRIWEGGAVDYMEEKAAVALMNDAGDWLKMTDINDTADEIYEALNDIYLEVYDGRRGRA